MTSSNVSPLTDDKGQHVAVPDPPLDTVQCRPSVNLNVELTRTFLAKHHHHRKQHVDLDDESGKPSSPTTTTTMTTLLASINDTIACSRRLPVLYARVDADPHLFISTFMEGKVNARLGVDGQRASTLVFAAINLLGSEAAMRRALEPVIGRDLDDVRHAGDIFRKDCQATRLLTYFAKALGQGILDRAVGPVLRGTVGGGSFEIDPSREPDPGQRMTNLHMLCGTAADLLRRVIADLPSIVVVLCRVVHGAIETKFPTYGWIGVSNFLFLRFICSAIVSSKVDSPRQKRNLILLAKLIQSVASLNRIGGKEQFMQVANPFVAKVVPQLTQFYDIFHGAMPSSATSVDPLIVTRKISSLARIAEYLELLCSDRDALSLTPNAFVTSDRRLIISSLHSAVFAYDDDDDVVQYPIESIESAIVTSNTVLSLFMSDNSSSVPLSFVDEADCHRCRDRINALMASS